MADKPTSCLPSIYANLYPKLVALAREHGYALAVHGSMARDFDLIAAPWTEDAASAEVLIEAIRERIGGFIVNDPAADPADFSRHNPQLRAHGRLGWAIQLGGGPYIDVSVMPRQVAADPA